MLLRGWEECDTDLQQRWHEVQAAMCSADARMLCTRLIGLPMNNPPPPPLRPLLPLPQRQYERPEACCRVCGGAGRVPSRCSSYDSSLFLPSYDSSFFPPCPCPTGDEKYKQRASEFVDALKECQDALDEGGYLSAFPSEHFDRLEALQPVWAPYYVVSRGLVAPRLLTPKT